MAPRQYSCSAVALIASILFLLNHLQPADSRLILTYYIHRYGARNILPKTPLLTESNATGGPALLPFGRTQNHDAGEEFRARYLSLTTCNKTDTCLSTQADGYGVFGRNNVEYNNYNTLVRSSGLDRTIAAGNAFLGGMFPNATDPALPDYQQSVPVYSMVDAEDWLIRSYTKCPEYNSRLEAWYASPEFNSKIKQSADLRAQVAAMEPTLNTSLTNWWNVYDAFNTWQTYGYGNQLSRLSNNTFAQVVDLANWLESSKMHHQFTSNMLGGPLLADMLAYMSAANGAVSSGQVYYKLVGISGHYNVLMAIPSALNMDATSTYPWKDRIPPFASLLVFEMHVDAAGANPCVRAVYQEGPTTAYKTMPLPCAVPGDMAEQQVGPGACTYENFVQYAQPHGLSTPGAWCTACKNMQSNTCKVYWFESQGKTVKQAGQSGHTCKWDETTTIAVSVVASAAGTALLMAAGWLLVRRWGSFRYKSNKMDFLHMHGMEQVPSSPVQQMAQMPGQHV